MQADKVVVSAYLPNTECDAGRLACKSKSKVMSDPGNKSAAQQIPPGEAQ
jgi:hypothetical protein